MFRNERTIHACTAFVLVAGPIAGLAGCALDLTLGPSHSPAEHMPQGVFTGEFIGDLPLYRFPTIVVVGSRSSTEWGADSD
jgi:hypothetical protein